MRHLQGAIFGVIAALLIVSGAAGQDTGQRDGVVSGQTVRAFSAGAHFFKRVVTDDGDRNFPGPADFTYQDMPGAGAAEGAIAVVAGQGTLVNIRFTGESYCAGGGTDFGWCGVRVLVDGVEALPGGDYAFDSTDNGDEGTGSWESHAMDVHACVPNPTGAVRVVPVQVQWRVFSTDGDTTAPSFRIDDTSLTIESAIANCGSTATVIGGVTVE